MLSSLRPMCNCPESLVLLAYHGKSPLKDASESRVWKPRLHSNLASSPTVNNGYFHSVWLSSIFPYQAPPWLFEFETKANVSCSNCMSCHYLSSWYSFFICLWLLEVLLMSMTSYFWLPLLSSSLLVSPPVLNLVQCWSGTIARVAIKVASVVISWHLPPCLRCLEVWLVFFTSWDFSRSGNRQNIQLFPIESRQCLSVIPMLVVAFKHANNSSFASGCNLPFAIWLTDWLTYLTFDCVLPLWEVSRLLRLLERLNLLFLLGHSEPHSPSLLHPQIFW